jgi:hypothetical protein
MKYKIIMLCLVIFIIQSNLFKASAYDNKFVHQMINGKAMQQSLNFQNNLNVLGFKDIYDSVNKKEIWQWFYDGARLEDETDCRSKFHFHDPTKSWNNAGLSNTIIDTYCSDYRHRSSLVWAQDADNLWTWQKARQYYVEALTTLNRDLREQKFANTFRSLGQVMHLVADSSVPAHTRNDIHVFPFTIPGIGVTVGGPTFESWAQDNYKNLSYSGTSIDKSIFSQAVYNSLTLSPVSALWDQDKYTGTNPDITALTAIGLAEYSNANFFSEDTIFSDFSFPAWSSVVEYNEVIDTTTGKVRTYLKKNKDGETINHLAAGKWFYKYLPSVLKSSGLKLDEQVYSDYASLLIPRAVGYSAGLLNYFFRGTLEISAPDQYVYSIIDGSKTPQQFTKIKAKVMNTTPNEDMQNGIIQAVAKYRKRTNYQPDLSQDPPTAESRDTDFYYSVSAQKTLTQDEIDSLNIQPKEFTFDFTGDSTIPAGITDLFLLVIFKGTLGNETDNAVAVGMKDLKEPTHHVFWNLSDMFSLYHDVNGTYAYHLHTSDDIKNNTALLRLVDFNGNGVPNDLQEPYINPYPIKFEFTYMPESDPVDPVYSSAKVENLPEGRYVRLIALVDGELTDNYVKLAWTVTLPDREPEESHTEIAFQGVTYQEENGIWQPSAIDTFRNTTQHLHTGVLRCEPVLKDPDTGHPICPYPEEEAIVPPDLTPYQAEIVF